MPRVIIAPDKFKGSLPAAEVAAAIARGIRTRAPEAELVALPIADGGDGTVAAAVAAGFTRVPVSAEGPTGEPITTGYARKDKTAVLELADVSGLGRLPGGEHQPMTADTFGLGMLIRAALDDGCRHLVIGLGGSASTDGGAGLVRALGAKLVDPQGKELARGGGALASATALDLTGLDPRLAEAELTVASDVDNPLCGPNGAAAIYGPQKGASESQVRELDEALARWDRVVARATGRELAGAPGAGAAGGAGFGLLAVLGARFRPGIDVVLELIDFHTQLTEADLMIIGEGSLDEQTLRGKGPAGVAAAARAKSIPVVAVAGRNLLDADTLRENGIEAVYPLAELEPDVRRSMANAADLLVRIGDRIARERLR